MKPVLLFVSDVGILLCGLWSRRDSVVGPAGFVVVVVVVACWIKSPSGCVFCRCVNNRRVGQQRRGGVIVHLRVGPSFHQLPPLSLLAVITTQAVSSYSIVSVVC